MPIEEHILEEILMDFADDPKSVSDRAAIESHLDACALCQATLDDFRTFATALADEETWWAAEEISTGEGLQALQDFADRLAQEDAEAARLLDRVLESQYIFTHANIVRRRRFHTGGVVRLLTLTSREKCVDKPRFARILAETAGLIAEALPDSYYPAAAVNELRGGAWLEYATACRYLGRFENGFDGLNRAERAYRRLLDPGTQLAVADLSRALLLWEQERYEEALRLCRSAADRFSKRGELERYLQASETEAIILHRLGDVKAAAQTYSRVFDFADSISDLEMKARAARNLAAVHRDRGDTGSASRYLLTALQLYEDLGWHAMVVQTRWCIAALSLIAGNAADAAMRLPREIANLTKLGMRADAARAQLDLAEALIVLQRFDDVRDVCSALVSFFRSANMLTGAVTAAAFLKEAAAKGTIQREHITHVRRYLDQLDRSPDLIFAPPPEAL